MTFYNTVKNVISGKFLASQLLGANEVGTIYESASKAKGAILKALNMQNSFLEIISSIQDFVSDSTLYGGEEGTDEDPFTVIIGSAVNEELGMENGVELFFSDLNDWSDQFCEDDPLGKKFHITVPSGKVFEFIYSYDNTDYCQATLYARSTISGVSVDRVMMTTRLHDETDPSQGIDVLVRGAMWDVTQSGLFNFWDVIGSEVENVVLMDAMNDTLDLCIGTSTLSVADVYGIAATYVSSNFKSLKEFGTGLVRASVGGIDSVVVYILNFFQALSTASWDSDDDVMTFTDNTGLVPEAYFAGIISIIGEGLQALSTAIALIGGTVIGILGTVISTGLQIAGKIFDIDPSDTYPSLVYVGRNLQPDAPYAIGQYTNAIDSIEIQSFIQDVSFDENGKWSYAVPGGHLYIGMNGNGEIIKEFHPDLLDRRKALNSLISVSSSNVWNIDYNDLTLDDFMEIVSNNTESAWSGIYNDKSGHVVNGQAALRDMLLANFAIFVIYCNIMVKTGSQSSTMQIKDQIFELDDQQAKGRISTYRVGSLTPAVTEFSSSDYENSNRTAIAGIFWWACYYTLLEYDRVPAFIASAMPGFMDWTLMSKCVVAGCEGKREYATVIGNVTVTYGLCTTFSLDIISSTLAYYNDPLLINNYTEYSMKPPKYDSNSFWAGIIISAVVTAVVVITTVAITLGVKKALRRKKLKNALKVEQAYQTALKTPSTANIAAYDKAVRRNNIWASVFGGTKYSREGLWGNTSSTSDGSSSGLAKIREAMLSNNDTSGLNNDVTLTTIYHSIVGSPASNTTP